MSYGGGIPLDYLLSFLVENDALKWNFLLLSYTNTH